MERPQDLQAIPRAIVVIIDDSRVPTTNEVVVLDGGSYMCLQHL